jgi:hypothetical protein
VAPPVISRGPVTLWTGWDVRGGASADPGAPKAFAESAPHDPGGDAHYEFLAVVARGFRPPRFLSTVDSSDAGPTSDQVAAEEHHPGLRATWSLRYQRVAETSPAKVAPYAIYLLGVNPPDGATEAELDVFNDFYTNVHLPEVAERRHALRAVRYELLEEVRPPYKGAPQFLAAYEVDEAAAAVRRHVGPPYATGPDVWQRHTTPWRLWYRRLVAEESDGDRSDTPK